MSAIEYVYVSYGGVDVTNQVKANSAFTYGMSIPAQGYANLFSCGDVFPDEYKDFVVMYINRDTTPPRCEVVVANEYLPITVPNDPSPSATSAIADWIVDANYSGLNMTSAVKYQFDACLSSTYTFPDYMFYGNDPLFDVTKAFVVTVHDTSSFRYTLWVRENEVMTIKKNI